MKITVHNFLEQKFRQAFNALGIAESVSVVLQESTKPEFGDYQVNGAMAAAKQLKLNPRELAQNIIAKVELAGIATKLEIAGPGFINITLVNDWLSQQVNQNLSVAAQPVQTIVVDLSAPNLAKEMHVGHLRSTVIGDALVRINEYLGNKVIRQNHVGDWGTQFGMLITYMLDHDLLAKGDYPNPDYQNTTRVGSSFNVKDLEVFYQGAKKRFDEDPEFAQRSRDNVVKLQNWSQNPEDQPSQEIFKYWTIFRNESLRHCQEVYDKLAVELTEKDVCGESFYETYNGGLVAVIKRLAAKNLLVESNGAKCVFFSEGELPGGEQTPYIVQKNDSGYLYSTSDLAAVDYRVHFLHAAKVLYVVDARQSFHFKQLFITAKKAGFADADSELIHVPFGTMMGEDGKPFKTRTGGTVKLIDLIKEAIERAQKMIRERNPEWAEHEINNLAQILGISAMKYADLSKNRLSDYIFSFDKMLAFEGNTAPYLLYAYTRINSIFNKAGLHINDYLQQPVLINEVDEHRLSLHLIKFADCLLQTAQENYPHYLCSYIYELAGLFMKFYESCPILKLEVPAAVKNSRLALAAITASTLRTSLGLLGIPIVEKM